MAKVQAEDMQSIMTMSCVFLPVRAGDEETTVLGELSREE